MGPYGRRSLQSFQRHHHAHSTLFGSRLCAGSRSSSRFFMTNSYPATGLATSSFTADRLFSSSTFSPSSSSSVSETELPRPLWIFGYGSLIWKPPEGIPCVERREGYITGFQRYFYWLSMDHRGVPAAPGRVVSLLPSVSRQQVSGTTPDLDSVQAQTHINQASLLQTNDSMQENLSQYTYADMRTDPQIQERPTLDRCWGVAYRIADEEAERAIRELDFREKGGYTRYIVPIRAHDDSIFAQHGVVYIGEDPDHYAPASNQIIAETIAQAVGPSGANYEYLFNLAEALRQMNVHDQHIMDLEARVKRLMQKDPQLSTDMTE